MDTLAPLPVFTDWRAAYLGQDGDLHAVTLDGKTDVSGPQLQDLGPEATDPTTAGFTISGHSLAYSATVNPHLLSVANGRSTDLAIKRQVVYRLVWSPDGSQVAIGDDTGGFGLAEADSAAYKAFSNVPISLPGKPGLWQMWTLLGWVDRTHLAITYIHPQNIPPSSVPVQNLGVYDLLAHQWHPLATFSSAGQGEGFFSLSPDGTRAIFYNRPFRSDPYTPQVDEINMATGAVTSLPSISHTMGSVYGFTGIAWRPGTSTLAVATGFPENSDLKTWRVDLGADTMRQITPTGYPVGWAPNNGPLVLSSGWQSGVGEGPYTLSAVTCASDAQCSATTLTKSAMTFTFLGFVRTA